MRPGGCLGAGSVSGHAAEFRWFRQPEDRKNGPPISVAGVVSRLRRPHQCLQETVEIRSVGGATGMPSSDPTVATTPPRPQYCGVRTSPPGPGWWVGTGPNSAGRVVCAVHNIDRRIWANLSIERQSSDSRRKECRRSEAEQFATAMLERVARLCAVRQEAPDAEAAGEEQRHDERTRHTTR